VYTSDQLVAGRDDIFSVPLDGSSQPIRLSGPAAFVLTPDGQSIVAALNPDANEFFDSFVLIPIGGGEPIPLAENPYATGGIPGWGSHWQLSGNGKLLVFLADNNAGTREIFAVAIPEPGGVLVFLFAGFVSMARSRRRINLQ
jgi:hypothetical protein